MHDDATQLFRLAISVELVQTQSQPLDELQEVPSQLPTQLVHPQLGSQATDEAAKSAVARGSVCRKDFMVIVVVSRGIARVVRKSLE